MADIKTRTVDKTSIKTMDQSISASHRIRDAGAEIKHAGRQENHRSWQDQSEILPRRHRSQRGNSLLQTGGRGRYSGS